MSVPENAPENHGINEKVVSLKPGTIIHGEVIYF
jgi:hypothetical protein